MVRIKIYYMYAILICLNGMYVILICLNGKRVKFVDYHLLYVHE